MPLNFVKPGQFINRYFVLYRVPECVQIMSVQGNDFLNSI